VFRILRRWLSREPDDEDLVTLVEVESEMEAQIVADKLERDGIRSVAQDTGIGVVYGSAMRGSLKIRVLRRDLEQAREALELDPPST
jgi:hypothetical protein